MENIIRNMKKIEKVKLNLGCGLKYKKRWTNVDISDKDVYQNKLKVDVKHNFNVFPYPFPNNHFDEVLMDNVIEHLENPAKVIEEIERICKSGAIVKIIVPHFSYYQAYTDYTHKHYFTLDSIDVMLRNRDIEIVKKELEISNNPIIKIIGKIFTFSPIIYERFLYGYFPVQGIEWTLKVKK